MNAALVALVTLVCFALAYRFYSRWLARVVFQLDDGNPTPAMTHADGVDYVATPRGVLWGHHFSSIAGAAPIVGPAVAVIWGWVPALLWVVVGVITMGAVHDMSTLALSVRNAGRSIGDVTASVIGPRSRLLFLLVIFLLSMMVLAVFAFIISSLFVQFPGAILPIHLEIPVAVVIGALVRRGTIKLLWPSLAALVGLYAAIWLGAATQDQAAALVEAVMGPDPATQRFIWCLWLLGYSFVAAGLPVWLLLQPRDLINSHQLIVGLAAILGGLFIVQPVIVAPAFNAAPPEAMPVFPFLFITIACGAVSGFHGLVSSGTTSKQIARESDIRPIGYGAMLGEGALAMLATLAATAGFLTPEAWHDHFASWGKANGLAPSLAAFVGGAARFLEGVAIPAEVGRIVVAVLVISFAATSLDTATRIQRFVIQELAEMAGFKPLMNRWTAGVVAVGTALALLLAASPKGPGSGGLVLWPLFGSGNQALAALSMVVVSVWLRKLGSRYVLITLIPAVFLAIITGIGMVYNLTGFIREGNVLLTVLGGAILFCVTWIIIAGARVWRSVGAAQGSQGA